MPDNQHGLGNSPEHATGNVSTPCQGVGATTGPDGPRTQTAHESAFDSQNLVHREASHSITEIQAARERCLVELRAKHKVALREYQEAKAVWDAAEAATKAYAVKKRAAEQAVYGELFSQVVTAQRIINTLGELTPQQYLMARLEARDEGRRVLAQIHAERPEAHRIDINGLSVREHDLSYLIQQLEALL